MAAHHAHYNASHSQSGRTKIEPHDRGYGRPWTLKIITPAWDGHSRGRMEPTARVKAFVIDPGRNLITPGSESSVPAAGRNHRLCRLGAEGA